MEYFDFNKAIKNVKQFFSPKNATDLPSNLIEKTKIFNELVNVFHSKKI